jgi:hypothetical protein
MVRYFFLAALVVFLAGCQRSWTEKDKSEFLSGCISGSIGELGTGKAKTYCHCMLNRIMDKYPNANDAKYLKYDSTMARLGKDCLNQP